VPKKTAEITKGKATKIKKLAKFKLIKLIYATLNLTRESFF